MVFLEFFENTVLNGTMIRSSTRVLSWLHQKVRYALNWSDTTESNAKFVCQNNILIVYIFINKYIIVGIF